MNNLLPDRTGTTMFGVYTLLVVLAILVSGYHQECVVRETNEQLQFLRQLLLADKSYPSKLSYSVHQEGSMTALNKTLNSEFKPHGRVVSVWNEQSEGKIYYNYLIERSDDWERLDKLYTTWPQN